MPKSEKGSVKDIAKRIKAKGLQKLKFYCQMCEKQCRDANGFKCHIQSESHLRQMKLFSENASGIMDQYSREFEKIFLDTLRMLHGTVQVNANQVYQQVIRDKQHIHMNATIWATLKDFCQYLGKTGKCRVEETERGWYITYINRDVDQILRQQQAEQRIQAELEAEAEFQKRLEGRKKEASLALEKAGFQQLKATALQPRNEDETIQFALKKDSSQQQHSLKQKKTRVATGNVLDMGSDEEEYTEDLKEDKQKLLEKKLGSQNQQQHKQQPEPETTSPLNAAIVSKKRQREETTKQGHESLSSTKHRRSDPSVWLYRDIVVRIIDKDYKQGQYFRRKAYVDRVLRDDNDDNGDRYESSSRIVTAEITLIPDSKNQNEEVLRLPQESLETVVPKQTEEKLSRVRILRGPYRGKKADVLALNKKEYQGRLQLSDGTILSHINYEDFAQLA